MASSPVDDLTNALKEAAYVSVGLGVIAFQRFQVRRNEITKALAGPTEGAKGTIDLVGSLVTERVKMVEERVGAVLKR